LKVYPLFYPGSTFEHPPIDDPGRLIRLLRALETEFHGAAVAAGGLSALATERHLPPHERRRRAEDMAARRSAAVRDLREQAGSAADPSAVAYEADLRAAEQGWAAGIRPAEYLAALRLLHARSFAESTLRIAGLLDRIGLELAAAPPHRTKWSIVREAVAAARKRLHDDALTAHALRDPSAETRLMDLGDKAARFEVVEGASASLGLEISEQALLSLRAVVQDAIDAFPWIGLKQFSPR
jgi:hypothetical protein